MFDGSRDLFHNNLLTVKLSLRRWGWRCWHPGWLYKVPRSSMVHLCEVVTGHLLIELKRYVTCGVVIQELPGKSPEVMVAGLSSTSCLGSVF